MNLAGRSVSRNSVFAALRMIQRPKPLEWTLMLLPRKSKQDVTVVFPRMRDASLTRYSRLCLKVNLQKRVASLTLLGLIFSAVSLMVTTNSATAYAQDSQVDAGPLLRVISEEGVRTATTNAIATSPIPSRAEEEREEKEGSSEAHPVPSKLPLIDVDDLQRYIQTFADDSMEGREAGSRGGRAAGNYIIERFKTYGLRPGGTDASYVQDFGNGYRNLLGWFEGTDPNLKDEFIVIGAHYDHVGYGTPSNSYGPIGQIHNGADDNGSGIAGLLEIIEQMAATEDRPARSILFAFWDGEEKGLLGSEHWVDRPTLSLHKIKLMINIDMIGRLRNNRLEVYGSRTAPGLRRLATAANETGLDLEFNWDLLNDSDHYSFQRRNIPVLMYHTGLHGQYHRPSDDPHTINHEGLRDVARMTLRTAWLAANWESAPEFRVQARSESESYRKRFESPAAPDRPDRLGVAILPVEDDVREDEFDHQGVTLRYTTPGSPARAIGLRAGDRLMKVNGVAVSGERQFAKLITAAPVNSTLDVIRSDGPHEQLAVELRGNPVRVGLSWLPDAADPTICLVSEVIPGTVAADSGIQVGDRIYEVNGQTFDGSKGLLELLKATRGTAECVVERNGKLRLETLNLPD